MLGTQGPQHLTLKQPWSLPCNAPLCSRQNRTGPRPFWARAWTASQRPSRTLLLCARGRDTPTFRAPTPAIFVPPFSSQRRKPHQSLSSKQNISLAKEGQPLRQTPSPSPGQGREWVPPAAEAGAGVEEEELPWEVLPAVSPWARECVVSSVTIWPVMGRVIVTASQSCH